MAKSPPPPAMSTTKSVLLSCLLVWMILIVDRTTICGGGIMNMNMNAVMGFMVATTSVSRRPVNIIIMTTMKASKSNGDDDGKNNNDVDNSSGSVNNNNIVDANYQNAGDDDEDDDDLTDRFKYKVHALMGTYDPVDGVQDDEYQDGNIMNALMQFPQRYTFNVVGRIRKSSGDGEKEDNDDDDSDSDDDDDDYVSAVKQVVFNVTSDDEIVCEIKPRGKAFLKVQCEANVQSVTMINTIYDELDKLDATVMRF